jgi:hypothetical protein
VKSYWSVYACTFVTWHVSQNLHGHQHRQDLPKEDSASTSCRAIKGVGTIRFLVHSLQSFDIFFARPIGFALKSDANVF